MSTKGRYGVRIMFELALRSEKELLTARKIAKNQGISEKYVEQIISTLNKAHLVRSQRGASGGYRLAMPAEQTTIGQILRATEGDIIVADRTGGDPDGSGLEDNRATTDLWYRVREAVESVVDNVTLADLVAKHNESQNFSYII